MCLLLPTPLKKLRCPTFASARTFASPDFRLARIAPREYAVLFAALKRTTLLILAMRFAQEDEFLDHSNPYNLIRHIGSFLSRSTWESGLTTKKQKEENSQKVERPCKLVRNNEKTEGNQQVKAIEKYRLSSVDVSTLWGSDLQQARLHTACFQSGF